MRVLGGQIYNQHVLVGRRGWVRVLSNECSVVDVYSLGASCYILRCMYYTVRNNFVFCKLLGYYYYGCFGRSLILFGSAAIF